MTPPKIDPKNYGQAVSNFLRKYKPEGVRAGAEFVEDVRLLVIAAKVNFRQSQIDKEFVDETGDSYLQACLNVRKEV